MVGSWTYDWDYLILDLGGKGNETEEAGEVELGFVLLADCERKGRRRLKVFLGVRRKLKDQLRWSVVLASLLRFDCCCVLVRATFSIAVLICTPLCPDVQELGGPLWT